MCGLHHDLLFDLNDFFDDRHLSGLDGCLGRCLNGLRAGNGAVGHEIEHLLRVLLNHGSALEFGCRRVHDGDCLGNDGRNNVLDEQLVLLQCLRLESVPFRDRLDDLEELLGAPVLGESQREFTGGCVVQLDVLDPAGALVHALVGQLAQVEIEAGLLEREDLSDGLAECLAELDRVRSALVDAEAVSVSLPSTHIVQ